ncbi:DUF1326 domain-containing protein [bacterium]|nr:DUF1326 domain-containing protein [bacterium]
MNDSKNWLLKGVFYECCRVEDGHCSLWFRRDLPHACTNMAIYQITEGHIQGVDMKDVVIILHQDGIGPTIAELVNGAAEGAAYVSDNITDEQRGILETFLETEVGIRPWRKNLGFKVVKISLTENSGDYHISMPFGEVKMSLTLGRDKKNPMRMDNPFNPAFSDYRFCNTDTWSFNDYGKNLTFKNASGMIVDFAFSG